jgi:Rrf2 family protein
VPDSAVPGSACLGFSAKTTYGLLALMELAGIEASGERLQVGEIAARQAIPERYLEQMMTSLRRAGLVRSVRGARGGYLLAKPATAISLADAINCLEGEAEQLVPSQGTCELQLISALAEELRAERVARLQEISLADFLSKRDAMLQAQTMYFI